MLSRVLEPEVMDTEEDAREYDAIDNSDVNELFAVRASELAPPRGRILDVGTGPGHIAIRVAQLAPEATVVAVDLADTMLALARRHVDAAGLANRVEVRRADGKSLDFPPASFDLVMSNSVVHHVPDTFRLFREIARIVRAGGALFVKDLHRPATEAELQWLVDTYAAGDTPHQRRLFADSLRAALTVDEVRAACDSAGLHDVVVTRTSDRHWVAERAAR